MMSSDSLIQFNNLTAIREIKFEDRLNPKRDEWLFVCDCGHYFHSSMRNFIRYQSTKCPQCFNLFNKKYGRLTIIKTLSPVDSAKCVCKCDCGNEYITYLNNIKRGATVSCGCYNRETRKKINDLTNQIFGNITVVELSHRRVSNKTMWWCKCDCGIVKEIIGADLLSGKTISCGCVGSLRRSLRTTKNIIGNRYGMLIVKGRHGGIAANHHVLWLCECDCGGTKIVSSDDLHSHKVISCGCKKVSYGELFVKQILLSSDFKDNFRQEVSIDGSRRKYDFAITTNNVIVGLIEFHGKQHYQPVFYFGGLKSFKKQQENDKKKILASIQKKVPLLIIPYVYSEKKIKKSVQTFLDKLTVHP